jgi:hypothetical protein
MVGSGGRSKLRVQIITGTIAKLVSREAVKNYLDRNACIVSLKET